MNGEDRQALLQIARNHMIAHLGGAAAAEPSLVGELGRHAGGFVTLFRAGSLRGCIGRIDADRPVARVIAQCAVAVCTEDPRFPPVTWGELPELRIELSVLGVFDELAAPDGIEIGRHGLMVELGRRKGLLLPQVATEWNWDARTLLEQTCLKAGLSVEAWRQGATLWRFEAEVFGEEP
jgi:AmmeMemoRadiSam system protein A